MAAKVGKRGTAIGTKNPRRPRVARTASGGTAAAEAVPLTPARIVAAAGALIEHDGLAAFSTRKLGAVLGVEAMSIYHHFPSKRHLLDALVDDAIGSVAFPPAGRPPQARLRALCYAYRAMAHARPGLFPLVALHRLNTPAGVAFIERVLQLVGEVVPDPEHRARQFRVIGYYLTGATLDETSGYARGPSAAEPVDDAHVARHCPRLAAAAPYFNENEWDATFAAGLDALFAGMEAMQPAADPRPLRGRRQPRGPTS